MCGFLLIAVSLAPRGANAQVRVGADVAYSTRYVWRGVTRTSQPVLQPQVYLAIRSGDAFFTAGGWASLEAFRADSTDLSDSGVDRRGLGEFNYWAEYAGRRAGLEFAVGWTGYIFDNDASRGGRSRDFNSGEIYGNLQLAAGPLRPKVALWYDVDRVKGAYIETSSDLRVPLLPLRLGPLRTIHLSGLAGWSVGQEVSGSESPAEANFAAGGLTHVGFSIWSSFFIAKGLTVAPVLHFQVNRDDFTRRTSGDPSDADENVKLWFTVSISWSRALSGDEGYVP